MDDIDLVAGEPVDPTGAARLILQSGPTLLPASMGSGTEDAIAALRVLFVEKANLFSHEQSLAVIKRGELAGILIGYDHATRNALRDRTGLLALRLLGRWRFFRALPLLVRLDGILSRTAPGEFYISNVAVRPDLRHQGLARRLLDATRERAARGGALRLTLDVEADNEPAVRLYTGKGFRVTRTSRPVRLLRGHPPVQFHYMACELPARP